MSDDSTLNLILDAVRAQKEETSNIWGEIRGIREALTTLARVEERQSNQREQIGKIEERVNTIFPRIEVLEKIAGSRGMVFVWIERVSLTVAGGVIMLFINMLAK